MNFYKNRLIYHIIGGLTLSFSILIVGCNTSEKDKNLTPEEPVSASLFQLLDPEVSGFYFNNELKENEKLNILNYEYLYNGSGVAIGDINNDGLPDIFMGGNLFGGRLFLNKGNLKFEQISETAGVFLPGYTTGVCFVDINNDGYDDIYLCRSLSENSELRRNVLLINNQDLTFTDRAAEYGLDDPSFSTDANFFDYDNDGDLDMYLLNHRVDFRDALTLKTYDDRGVNKKYKDTSYQYVSDKLYSNNGNGSFTDVTKKAGLVNRAFGLSVSVVDINMDGYQDIYVANDYADKDNLYINNKNGTFTDQINDQFLHMSKNSMGCDVADVNNDGLLDVMNLDMMSEDNYRQKQLKGQSPYDLYHMAVGYGLSHQVMRNTMQLNNGNGTFSEIGQLAGVSHTDWSWAPIFADFDNDGNKDLFISNGYYRDVTDMDYIKYESNEVSEKAGGVQKAKLMDLIARLKSNPQVNYLFKNKGDLTFSDVSKEWGIEKATFSNGTAYADLDLDGDLDLIVNNLNSTADLYENRANDQLENNFIEFKLQGDEENLKGIGTKITVKYNGKIQYQDFSPYKGYLSNHQAMIHFGLGETTELDEIIVDWGNGNVRSVEGVQVNKINVLKPSDGKRYKKKTVEERSFFTETKAGEISKFRHAASSFNDFKREPLLEHKLSNKGPFLSRGDVNGDQLEDVFVGGDEGSSGQLFIQGQNGLFSLKSTSDFLKDAAHTDAQSVFFDADGDSDLDLFVVSGGYQFAKGSKLYQDRLYLNDGQGNFSRSQSAIPALKENGSCALALDLENDGDLDLLVFGGASPDSYPMNARSYALVNTNGIFKESKSWLPNEGNLGIVNAVSYFSTDKEKTPEIVLAGEWMNITVLKQKGKSFTDITDQSGLSQSSGWWNSIEPIDVDGDGDLDFVAGNRGMNSFYSVSNNKPGQIIGKDFDQNGSLDALPFYSFRDGNQHPKHTLDEVFSQYPGIRRKFNRYAPYSNAVLSTMFSSQDLKGAVQKETRTFETSVFINDGKGGFTRKALPKEAQFSEVHGITSIDANDDGMLDLIVTGNNYGVDVEMGRSDASFGTVLLGNGNGSYRSLTSLESGVSIQGDARGCYSIETKYGKRIIVLRNNGGVAVLKQFVEQ